MIGQIKNTTKVPLGEPMRLLGFQGHRRGVTSRSKDDSKAVALPEGHPSMGNSSGRWELGTHYRI